MHVLIVDTSTAELRSISELLSAHHVSVSAAKSQEVAEHYLQNHTIDLLIIKVDERFESFIRDFCSNEKFTAVPVLLIPEKNASSVVKRFLAQGKEAVKPVAGSDPLQNGVSASDASLSSSETAGVHGSSESTNDTVSFPQIDGINWDEAVKNCGGQAIVPEVVQKFYDSIEDRISSIQRAFDAKDWKNYTVYVHSLKSAARLIGALSLSADARQLEAFGNCQSEDDITEKTPPVLEQLKVFKEALKCMVKTIDQKAAEDETKPLISEKDLKSALSDLRECLSITDFDSADFIVQELQKWQMPEDKKDLIKRIIKAVSDVQRTQALELLGGV